jgi:hypothetical protein
MTDTQEQDKKCAHESCTCTAEEGSQYCSTACEASKDGSQSTCGCGHSGCKAAAVAA